MSEAPRYEIRTIADLFTVPPDKRAHMLADLGLWMNMHEEAAKIFAGVEGIRLPRDEFTWIDDNAHDAHLQFHVVNNRPPPPEADDREGGEGG